MAALIKAETGLDPTVTVGKRGEFSVWVGDQTVAKKSIFGFPSDDDVVSAVQQALAAGKGA